MKTISKYWEQLNKQSNILLSEHGYENFKQTVAMIYNDNTRSSNHFEATKILWDYLYSVIPCDILDKFSEPSTGNPCVILRDNKLVSIDLGISLRDYWQLSQYVDFNAIESIVEIGGGYGRMPYVITQLHPHIEYTMCDIEPALGLAKHYLSEVTPNSVMKYTHPEELSGTIDLVIACNCLHEMSREQAYSYFDYVDTNSIYFYYNCWKKTTMPGDEITWTQNSYPVKDSWTKLFEQDYIRKNYFEVLYKCQA